MALYEFDSKISEDYDNCQGYSQLELLISNAKPDPHCSLQSFGRKYLFQPNSRDVYFHVNAFNEGDAFFYLAIHLHLTPYLDTIEFVRKL